MDCRADVTNELIELLHRQAAAIEAMLALAHRLQECLVHFDTSGIERSTREQESLIEQVGRMEEQRIALLATLLGISADRARQLTLSEICQQLPSDTRDTLETLADSLRTRLWQLQLANGINRMLALRGKNSIATTLSFVREQGLHAINTSL
ncbi:MAG: flagellar protein FlgN [Chlorobi bacterium]|jgi:hypothetical protein|nr:flagellar protein FlgN [Chlorobiota bacterium]